MAPVLETHREWLADPVRVAAFADALRQRVRPGDVVVDLGAGTGVLGLLACQAGAARVYAVEPGGVIEVARRVARANGCADRMVFINKPAADVELPERADGLVADQIGHFGFEAGLFDMVADAIRWLKPNAWTVPERVDLHVAPIQDAELRSSLDFWRRPIEGMDFSPAGDWVLNTAYPRLLQDAQLLGPSAAAITIRVAQLTSAPLAARVQLQVEREGLLDGFGGWFRASLAPGTVLSNAPDIKPRVQRRNVVLPLAAPVRVNRGDTVDLDLRIRPSDRILAWRGAIHARSALIPFSHSTLRGMLMTQDDLRRLNPVAVPRLTERGRARRSVLDLCDGQRTLDTIEREVQVRHPGLFRSRAQAAAFVAEVVGQYSE